MKKGTRIEKVARYTRAILVRLEQRVYLDLQERCRDIQMNEAVYGRKAIQICLRRGLINGKTHQDQE